MGTPGFKSHANALKEPPGYLNYDYIKSSDRESRFKAQDYLESTKRGRVSENRLSVYRTRNSKETELDLDDQMNQVCNESVYKESAIFDEKIADTMARYQIRGLESKLMDKNMKKKA